MLLSLFPVCIGVLSKVYKAIPAEDSSNQDKILKSLQDVCARMKGKEHKFVSLFQLQCNEFCFHQKIVLALRYFETAWNRIQMGLYLKEVLF